MKKCVCFTLGLVTGAYVMSKMVDTMASYLTKRGALYYEMRLHTPEEVIKTVGTPLSKKEENKEETSE